MSASVFHQHIRELIDADIYAARARALRVEAAARRAEAEWHEQNPDVATYGDMAQTVAGAVAARVLLIAEWLEWAAKQLEESA